VGIGEITFVRIEIETWVIGKMVLKKWAVLNDMQNKCEVWGL
jgi:hypothetical protein